MKKMADKLIYFDARARAEPVRMMYAFAGEKLEDERVAFADWPKKKEGTMSH